MQHIFKNIAEMQKNIQPLNINGLKGRMLRLQSSKKEKREILLVYGHHSSIERVYGIAEDLAQYGNVTVPDLPGFGGMDSFYTIGMKPTLDNLADYLATFIKLRYKNKKITISAMSLGFVIATRMLQRYPEMVGNVELLVSFVGFAHRDDLVFTKPRYYFYRSLATLFSRKLPSLFFYNVALHPSLLRAIYGQSHNAKSKFEGMSQDEKKQAMEFEVVLWRENDVRTYMSTTLIMLTLDNCKKHVALPLHHISVDRDQYFNNSIVEQHMRVVFEDFTDYRVTLPAHAPSIVANKEQAAHFMPDAVRELLNHPVISKKSKNPRG